MNRKRHISQFYTNNVAGSEKNLSLSLDKIAVNIRLGLSDWGLTARWPRGTVKLDGASQLVVTVADGRMQTLFNGVRNCEGKGLMPIRITSWPDLNDKW